MRKEQILVQDKINGKWKTINTIFDPVEIHKQLAHDIIAKKLHKCTYIRTIKDICNYDGTRNVIITYDNNVRRVYTIEF